MLLRVAKPSKLWYSSCMKKINLKFILLPLVILALFFIFLKGYCSDRPDPAAKKSKRLTNPLLQYVKFKELPLFRPEVEELIKKEKEKGAVTRVAVYFRDLSDGMWFGISEREKFTPASLLKIPIMMSYFKLAEKDPGILNKKIKYETPKSQLFSPGIKEKSSAEEGKYYTVDELVRFMIVESDNKASLLLLENLPKGELKRTFANFRINPGTGSFEGDFVSLKICASFLRILYNASYLNEELSEKALRYLEECSYRDGIAAAGLPKDIIVAHKFGERFSEETGERQLHEIAIVYYPESPYILAVMTSGKDYAQLARVIKDISELVYKNVDASYKAVDDGSFVFSE